VGNQETFTPRTTEKRLDGKKNCASNRDPTKGWQERKRGQKDGVFLEKLREKAMLTFTRGGKKNCLRGCYENLRRGDNFHFLQTLQEEKQGGKRCR